MMRTIKREKENILFVRTLGGFSLSWNGALIAEGSKSNESQFTYLLQILLHNYLTGVSRNRLEELLFEDRDIRNMHHAIQSVIYNAKKKLKRSGLPEVNYILQKKGVFYWNQEIPVCEDAMEFERLYQEAEQTKDPDKRLELYLEACHCYSGEFLPAKTGVIWVAQEARRFHGIFCACMEQAVNLLRDRQDYFQMKELGIYASRTSPLADWEVVTMEALVALGYYEDARKLYEDTVAYYFQEQGLRPSRKLLEMLNRLSQRMDHRYEVLDTIQMDLLRTDNSSPGGYLCTYPVFQGVYRMVERMMERGGQSVYLMLCTVIDSKGNPMKEGALLEEFSQRLEEAIYCSIRRSDVFSRYGRGQYLVLLINTTYEDISIIQRRINSRFMVGRQRVGIQYYVNNVSCGMDR